MHKVAKVNMADWKNTDPFWNGVYGPAATFYTFNTAQQTPSGAELVNDGIRQRWIKLRVSQQFPWLYIDIQSHGALNTRKKSDHLEKLDDTYYISSFLILGHHALVNY